MNNNVKDALRNYKRYKTRAHILDVIAMFPGKIPIFIGMSQGNLPTELCIARPILLSLI